MAPIQHFAPPAGIKSPPLSFATRTGDLLFVSGIPGFDDKGALADGFEAQFGCVVANLRVRARALPRPHHLRGAGAARSENADRDRMRGTASAAVMRHGFRFELRRTGRRTSRLALSPHGFGIVSFS
jgi:hypothetical protein